MTLSHRDLSGRVFVRVSVQSTGESGQKCGLGQASWVEALGLTVVWVWLFSQNKGPWGSQTK